MARANPDHRDSQTELSAASTSEISDRSLLCRFRAGQEDAATALYLRYAKRLSALARRQASPTLATRVDPEDVVQSVFRTFFRRVTQGHYDVADGDELWRLFLVIALNKVRTLAAFHRAAKRDISATAGSAALTHHAAEVIAEDQLALSTLQIVINDVLGELPAAQREMVELRIAGHEVAEIAERCNRSKRSVERILQSFRERLSHLIQEE